MFIYYYSTKSGFNQCFRTDRLIEEGGDAIAPPPRKKKLESKAAGPAKSVITVRSRRTADEPKGSEVSDKETRYQRSQRQRQRQRQRLKQLSHYLSMRKQIVSREMIFKWSLPRLCLINYKVISF